MHRTSGPVRRSILGVAIAAALLTACSLTDDGAAEAEVRGVTLERDATGEALPGDAPSNGDTSGGGSDLVLLRSGPLAVGTVWLAAAGDWVGLDAQVLERGAEAERAHLDVVLDADGARAAVRGCTLRLVAPDDATFEAIGVVTAEVVLEDAQGGTVREPVDTFDLEVVLAPGQAVDLDVAPDGDTTIDVGPGDAVQVHCEGRFDRA